MKTLSYLFTAVISIVGLTQVGLCQTTNCIPKNLFLTDNERLFWDRPSGERVVNISAIKEAQTSTESLPADLDSEGRWGLATNGFQLCLRLEKNIYTNGEPIIITMLMRNVTDQTQIFYRPIKVIAAKDGVLLERKKDNLRPIDVRQINMLSMMTVFPQTQRRFTQNLCQVYDLIQNGEYVLQALSDRPEVSSQAVRVKIQ